MAGTHISDELLEAALLGDYERAARALEAGASVDSQNEHSKTPLMLAAEGGHTELVSLLLSWGAQTELKDSSGATALYLAASANQCEVTELLLKWRADPDARDNDGHFALEMTTLYENRLPLLKLLLKYRANPNLQNAEGITPMMWALDDREALRELIKHGADWRIRDRHKKHAFDWAMDNCSHEAIEILKSLGAELYLEKKKR